MKTIFLQESIRLPFLGVYNDSTVIEYLLLKLTIRSALIVIPNWTTSRMRIVDGVEVDLRINNYFYDLDSPLYTLKGTITLLESIMMGGHSLYRVEFDRSLSEHCLLEKLPEFSLEDVTNKLLELLKDTALLKSGIFIYLKHLIPYFSRLMVMSQHNFEYLKTALLDQIHLQVFFNMTKLKTLIYLLEEKKHQHADFLINFDINAIRQAAQSELDKSLLLLALENTSVAEVHNEAYSFKSFQVYIDAVKSLENRIYSNYNNILILYSRAVAKHAFSHRNELPYR